MGLFATGRAINNGNNQLKSIEQSIENLVYKTQHPFMSHPDQMELQLESIREKCNQFVEIISQTRASSLCSYFFNGQRYSSPEELLYYLGHLLNGIQQEIDEIRKKNY